MTLMAPNPMQVVKREEKETKLAQFILGEIAAGRVALGGEWLVMALSADSPVVAALRRVLGELGGASDLEVRAVLLQRPELRDAIDLGADQAVSLRFALRPSLLDAHEQLVLGPQSAWVGDCMRRDPRERDAYETFGTSDCELARRAARSFTHFWRGAEPAKRGLLSNKGAAIDVIAPAAEKAEKGPMVAATSRH